MKKQVKISFLSALFFSLPSILSYFIYVYIVDKTFYYIIYFILILLSFFIMLLTLILKLFIKKHIVKTLFLSSFVVFLTLSLVFSGNVILHKLLLKDLPPGANYLKFEQEQWQENAKTDNYTRQYMLKDLIKNILPKKSKSEIISILGKPDNIYEDKIEYLIGPERSYFAIDLKVLHLFFDKEDIYTHYKITSG